jgi:two-component system, sensor histidine kinase PdtaS
VFSSSPANRAAAFADWRWRATWALVLGRIAAALIVGLGTLARRLALLEGAAQKALAGKASELQQALENAKLLHRELQHRTKNNLQLVVSLLRVGTSAKDPTEAMRAAIARVGAIARAHADLHGDIKADQAHSQNVITETVRALTSGMPDDQIMVDVDVADCTLPVEKAAPLALIVNEVTTNALKYGVSGDGPGHISVSAKLRESLLHIEIRDRGPGFPEGAVQRKSTGLRIVDGLAQQIDARYQFVNDGGAVFRLDVALDQPKPSNG